MGGGKHPQGDGARRMGSVAGDLPSQNSFYLRTLGLHIQSLQKDDAVHMDL